MVDLETLKIGDKVCYTTKYSPLQNGIVKDFVEGENSIVRVVFHCNDDWDNYRDYTAESTRPEDLTLGWL